MEKNWRSAEIHKLFRLQGKIKSRQTLFNAENRNEIPKAKRIPRGKQLIRQWDTSQLPAIGSKFGFLKPPKRQQVICVSTGKGGILKSNMVFNLSRGLAFNSIKTLVIGLDIQKSITGMLIPQKKKIKSLDEISDAPLSIYHLIYEKAALKEVILKTDLPTLDVIPETTDLNSLEKKLRLEIRKEYSFRDKLLPLFKDYQVIIWDNSPNWNSLIECSLVASNHILTPIGCDVGTYEALNSNLNTVSDFQNAMKIDWDTFTLIPTLLEKTKLSQQIYVAYLNRFKDDVLNTPIRRAIVGQESSVLSMSVLEHDPMGNLGQDYYDFITTYWDRILKSEIANIGH